jgi:glycosyltransferase involved in cell wall biosynthesis
MENRISFCTVSMNRVHHIKKTLLINLMDNAGYHNCEFVLLDYNSSDGLEDFVKEQLKEYIISGRLKYYRTNVPAYFHRAHALNTAFKLSSGDVVCNVDADNYTGKGFAAYINDVFNHQQDIFLTVDLEKYGADVCGRVCMKRKDFFRIGGYDETMDCWGHDDDDIKNRLSKAGLEKVYISGPDFFKAITHGTTDRLANEYHMKFLHTLYLCQLSPAISHVLMLFNDEKFVRVVLVDYARIHAGSYHNALQETNSRYRCDIDETAWLNGTWRQQQNSVIIQLMVSGEPIQEIAPVGNVFRLKMQDEIYDYKKIYQEYLISEILIHYSYAKNRIQLKKNLLGQSAQKNHGGFGKGVVYGNFDYIHPIQL